MPQAQNLPPPGPPPGPGDVRPTAYDWIAPPPPEPRRRSWPIVLGAIVAVLGLVAATLVVLDPFEEEVAWDPEIRPLADFVERERGLDFDHPVEVEFLDGEEYRASFAVQAELDEEELDELSDFFAAMRAMGLVSSDFDATEIVEEFGGEGTVGFYDYETERLVVRGNRLSPYVQGTVVHELTHALQDQHFDLGRAFEEDIGDGEAFAFRAVTEGDAVLTELAYVDSLPTGEQEQYAQDEAELVEGADLGGVPEAVLLGESAPYTFGPSLIWVAEAREGEGERDRLLEAPPTSEEQVIDPTAFLRNDGPEDVAIPELDEGAEEVDSGEFGVLTLAIMLGERIDPRVAVDAALGWAGDAYVIFRDDEQVCLEAAFTGDGEAETGEIADALDAWARSMPPGSVSTERAAGEVSVRSCDPGADAPETTGGSADTLGLLALRASTFAQAYRQYGDVDGAACLADASIDVVDSTELDVLGASGEPDPELVAELTQRSVELAAECFG